MSDKDRLGSIIYVQSRPAPMVSRPGQHLLAQQDKALSHIVGVSYQQTRAIPEKTNYATKVRKRDRQFTRKRKTVSKPIVSTNQTMTTTQTEPTIEQETQEPVYNDDLAFLNRFDQKKIAKMQPVFKNTGRGTIRAQKHANEKGMWSPAVGTYSPLMLSLIHI